MKIDRGEFVWLIRLLGCSLFFCLDMKSLILWSKAGNNLVFMLISRLTVSAARPSIVSHLLVFYLLFLYSAVPAYPHYPGF